MRHAKAAALLLLSLCVIGAGTGQVRGQTAATSTSHHAVPRDTETRVGSQGMWKKYGNSTSCMTNFLPTLQLITPPTHGTVRFATGDVLPDGSGCSAPFSGTVVWYRPNPGFVGDDQFTYQNQADPMAMNRVGPAGLLRTVIVTVK